MAQSPRSPVLSALPPRALGRGAPYRHRGRRLDWARRGRLPDRTQAPCGAFDPETPRRRGQRDGGGASEHEGPSAPVLRPPPGDRRCRAPRSGHRRKEVLICLPDDRIEVGSVLRATLAERDRAGLLRSPVHVATPPGRYLVGEESALVDWIRGGPGLP